MTGADGAGVTRTGTDSKQMLEALEMMWLIRAFEEKVSEFYARGRIQGLLHLGIGQEAIAVGAASRLDDGDVVFGGHRAHAHALARGADPERLMAELAGRATGYCAGKGGSMHISALEVGFVTATGIVAQNIPLALGAAWAIRLEHVDRVSVAFFGDGAGQSGAFHESLNIASLWNLPVVLVCENNGFAEFTPLSAHTRVARLTAYPDVYGIPTQVVDGNDVRAVGAAVGAAVGRARNDEGPTFVEAISYRMRGHYEGDVAKYRDSCEVAEWRRKDPIARLAREMIDAGTLDQHGAAEVERTTRGRVELAAERAMSAPLADPGDLLRSVYA